MTRKGLDDLSALRHSLPNVEEFRPKVLALDGVCQAIKLALPSNPTKAAKAEALAKQLLGNGDVVVNKFKVQLPDSGSEAANQPTILGHLRSLLVDEPLFVRYYKSRKMASSGLINERKQKILMTNPLTRHIIKSISKEFTIKDLSLTLNECGMQNFHNDKFRPDQAYHMLLSFLTSRKMMWLRKNGVIFGIEVPHCAMLLMTKVGSGAVSEIQHGVGGGQNDFLLAWNLAKLLNANVF